MRFKDHLLEAKRTPEASIAFLKRHGIVSFATVNDKGEIDSPNHSISIRITGSKGNQLPKFGTVLEIQAAGCDLRSLASWSPHTVKGLFNVSTNQLRTLKGGPTSVGEHYDISYNQIKSLKGSPAGEISGIFSAQANKLVSLEGITPVIGGNLDIRFNSFTSLKDINLHVKKIGGVLFIQGNNILTHVMGLFLIEGLTQLSYNRGTQPWAEIVDAHLKHGRDNMIDCQHELIEHGYEELAKL